MGNIQKNILTSIVLLFSFCCSAEVSFISCHDGDTCRFKVNGVVEKVRLSGIDAPEIGEPFARESKEKLESLIVDKKIELKCDGYSYDRRTCVVIANGVDIQQDLVAVGLAFDSPKYSGGKYLSAERKAKIQKIGIWSQNLILSPHCQRWIGTPACNKNPLFMPN